MSRLGMWVLVLGFASPVLSRTASADVVVVYGDPALARGPLAGHCVIVPRYNSAWAKRRDVKGVREHLKVRSFPPNWSKTKECPEGLHGTSWYDWVYDEEYGRLYRRKEDTMEQVSSQRWLLHDDVNVRASYVDDVIRMGVGDELHPCRSECRAYHREWAYEKPEREAAWAKISSMSALLGVSVDPTAILVAAFLDDTTTLLGGVEVAHSNGRWAVRNSGGEELVLNGTVSFSLFENPQRCILEKPRVPAWKTQTGWLVVDRDSKSGTEIPFDIIRPSQGGSCSASDGDVVVRELVELKGAPLVAQEHRNISDVLLHWPRARLPEFVVAYDWRKLRRRPNGTWKEILHRVEVRARTPELLRPVADGCISESRQSTVWSVWSCPSDVTLDEFEGVFRWY